MTRVKRGSVARKRRQVILNFMKGSKRAHSRLTRTAQQQFMKKLFYSYRSRRIRKRDFRSLWITRMNAASRLQGLSYSRFIQNLRQCNIALNRKSLAQISVLDRLSFNRIIQLTGVSS